MSLVWTVLGAGALHIALAAVFPGLPAFLGTQVECVTPMSSFTRLREGLYLYAHGMSPYDGGPFHQSPLLLALFSTLGFETGLAVDVFFAVVNAAAAWQLARVAAPPKSYSAAVTAAVFLLNPFTLLGSLARSTQALSNAAIVTSFGAAAANRPVQGVMFLALAACLSWYPAYFLPSLIVYAGIRPTKLVVVFVLSCLAFIGLAYLPVSSWNFVDKQFGTLLFMRDLTSPNLGLWWYFFIEMFDAFRPFFLGAFQLFLASFPLPLVFRFPTMPLFSAAALAGILAAFKPYPEVADLGLYITFLFLNRQVIELLEYPLVVGLGFLYVAALAPTFYYLWIYLGSGNANFFYAITLVYSIILIVSLADAIWTAIRIDHDGGKDKSLAQI